MNKLVEFAAAMEKVAAKPRLILDSVNKAMANPNTPKLKGNPFAGPKDPWEKHTLKAIKERTEMRDAMAREALGSRGNSVRKDYSRVLKDINGVLAEANRHR